MLIFISVHSIVSLLYDPARINLSLLLFFHCSKKTTLYIILHLRMRLCVCARYAIFETLNKQCQIEDERITLA